MSTTVPLSVRVAFTVSALREQLELEPDIDPRMLRAAWDAVNAVEQLSKELLRAHEPLEEGEARIVVDEVVAAAVAAAREAGIEESHHGTFVLGWVLREFVRHLHAPGPCMWIREFARGKAA